EVCGDAAEGGQEPLRLPRRGEAFHGAFADPGRLMGVLGAVEFSTDVKCCDESGGRFMLVAERAMPWSAWRLLSWHARSARCVVGVCGGDLAPGGTDLGSHGVAFGDDGASLGFGDDAA